MKAPFLLLALLVLAGCSSPAPSPAEPARPAAKPADKQLADKRVTVDPALAGILQVVKVRDMSATQGYLKFQVDVQNLTSSAKTIIYQVDWLDADGASLGITMEQPPCTLFPKETLPLAIAAPAPIARDIHITFRPRSN
jgi:uncharacterized protein YcfL